MDGTIAANGISIDRCCGYAKVIHRGHSSEAIPELARVAKDFHGTGGGGGEGLVEKEDSDVKHWAITPAWLNYLPIMAKLPSCSNTFLLLILR